VGEGFISLPFAPIFSLSTVPTVPHTNPHRARGLLQQYASLTAQTLASPKASTAAAFGGWGLQSPTNQGDVQMPAVLKSVLQACRIRVGSRRVPPNCLPMDWFEEIEAIETIATRQAERGAGLAVSQRA
jgi:hypothetical protein